MAFGELLRFWALRARAVLGREGHGGPQPDGLQGGSPILTIPLTLQSFVRRIRWWNLKIAFESFPRASATSTWAQSVSGIS